MSSICMSWLGVEASFGSGATTGFEPVNSLPSTVPLENSERSEPKGIILLCRSCPFFDAHSLVALLIPDCAYQELRLILQGLLPAM